MNELQFARLDLKVHLEHMLAELEAAAQLEPRARLAKVDTEQNQMLAQRYGIRSIPTLAIFKGGRQVEKSTTLDKKTMTYS